jgi:hypothetical protein
MRRIAKDEMQMDRNLHLGVSKPKGFPIFRNTSARNRHEKHFSCAQKGPKILPQGGINLVRYFSFFKVVLETSRGWTK